MRAEVLPYLKYSRIKCCAHFLLPGRRGGHGHFLAGRGGRERGILGGWGGGGGGGGAGEEEYYRSCNWRMAYLWCRGHSWRPFDGLNRWTRDRWLGCQQFPGHRRRLGEPAGQKWTSAAQMASNVLTEREVAVCQSFNDKFKGGSLPRNPFVENRLPKTLENCFQLNSVWRSL